MKILTFISNIAIPVIIFIIISLGVIEKKEVFDLFLKGAKEGIKIMLKIFPTLIGLFVAITVLKDSGLIEFLTKILGPFLDIINFPKEVMPLAILRPISGNASIAVATDIMKNYGVDTKIGIIASTIMGSTETTIYTIAVYSSSVGVKNTRFVLFASIIADVVRNFNKCVDMSNNVLIFKN